VHKVPREPCIVSVPSSELGPPPPPPSPASENVLPPNQIGEHTRLRGEGGGGYQVGRLEKKPSSRLYSVDLWNVTTSNVSGVV
jgi:hypothetical protein